MNKKLMILIVALECVFSVFLISIFGPMIEALHTPIDVQEIYFLDEDGNRLPNDSVIELESDARSHTLSWCALPEEATDPTLTISVFIDGVEITSKDELTPQTPVIISPESDGMSARFTFRVRKSMRITVYSTDGGGVSATVTLVFGIGDPPEIDPPF